MGNNGLHLQRYKWRGIWISSKKKIGGFVNNTDKTIKIGSIGDIDAGDKNSNGYNMVIFSSST